MKKLIILFLIIGGIIMTVFGFGNNKCKHEVYTKEEVDKIESTVIQDIIYDIENKRVGYYELRLRKIGNTVYVDLEVGRDANVDSLAEIIDITEKFPDWAKVSYNQDLLRDERMNGISTFVSDGYEYLTSSSVVQASIYKQIDNYRLSIAFASSSFASNSSDESYRFKSSYLAL